jgi:hypothetical protein
MLKDQGSPYSKGKKKLIKLNFKKKLAWKVGYQSINTFLSDQLFVCHFLQSFCLSLSFITLSRKVEVSEWESVIENFRLCFLNFFFVMYYYFL